jgi:hypothetical protein
MNKNLFINIITALQEQYDDDLAKAYLMGKVLDIEANPYDNSKLSNAIFKLLRLYFKDKTSDIEIFCWEQNFGRMNNVSIEKLWDFLQEPTSLRINWDDEANDAKYSKKIPTEYIVGFDPIDTNTTSYKGVYSAFEPSIKDYIQSHLSPLKDEKVSEAIKDIEVKDIIIISPLKKR